MRAVARMVAAVGDGHATVKVRLPVRLADRWLSGAKVMRLVDRPAGCECKAVCGCPLLSPVAVEETGRSSHPGRVRIPKPSHRLPRC